MPSHVGDTERGLLSFGSANDSQIPEKEQIDSRCGNPDLSPGPVVTVVHMANKKPGAEFSHDKLPHNLGSNPFGGRSCLRLAAGTGAGAMDRIDTWEVASGPLHWFWGLNTDAQ